MDYRVNLFSRIYTEYIILVRLSMSFVTVTLCVFNNISMYVSTNSSLFA